MTRYCRLVELHQSEKAQVGFVRRKRYEESVTLAKWIARGLQILERVERAKRLIPFGVEVEVGEMLECMTRDLGWMRNYCCSLG